MDNAWIDAGGVRGDYNVARHEKLGGDPHRALLLLPRETLVQLVDEGWPVAPGDLGENLTTSGLTPGLVGKKMLEYPIKPLLEDGDLLAVRDLLAVGDLLAMDGMRLLAQDVDRAGWFYAQSWAFLRAPSSTRWTAASAPGSASCSGARPREAG